MLTASLIWRDIQSLNESVTLDFSFGSGPMCAFLVVNKCSCPRKLRQIFLLGGAPTSICRSVCLCVCVCVTQVFKNPLDQPKWPYLSHFESDWCQILNLSLVCLKHLYYQFWNSGGHLGFWEPSWIFFKWPYLSHFESDWCQILNLNLVCLKHLHYHFLNFGSRLGFLKWPFLSHFQSNWCKILK